MRADAALLERVVANLVENALRHAGGEARVEVGAGLEGAAAVVLVRDDGPGVPESERGRVFDRFYRLEDSRSTPGNGLGLALVAAVARLHEASVSLADARPGLEVRIAFRPRPRSATLGIPNVMDSAPSSISI